METNDRELINRYIAEVGRYLPPKGRADILTELRSILDDNLEARSQGQPTQEDVINLLQEFGPPQKIAASYWPEGQYLIGPSLYPLFRMVVAIALLVTVIVQLVLLGVALIFQPETLPVGGFINDFMPTLIGVFGWVVVAFAIMQRLNVRPNSEEAHWNPSSLPPAQESEPFSRLGIGIEIAFGLALVVVLSILPEQLLKILPAGIHVYISPVLMQYLPLLVAAIVLSVGLNVILLWRGRWETPTLLAKIVLNLFGIGVLALLISGHTAWLAERGAAGFFTAISGLQTGHFSPEEVQILTMQFYRMAFAVALIGTLVDTLRIGWQLVKNLYERSGASAFTSSGASSAG